MTDRELLELAAKAAGLHIVGWQPPNDEPIVAAELPIQHMPRNWNPLTDAGDALRLAVQCGIEISFIDDEPDVRACAGYATATDPRIRYAFEDHRGDLFAATMRAIVRAAAEIGKDRP